MGRPLFSKFIEIEPEVKGPLQIDQKDIDNETPHYKHLYKVYFDMLEQCIPQLGKYLPPLTRIGSNDVHSNKGFRPFLFFFGQAPSCSTNWKISDIDMVHLVSSHHSLSPLAKLPFMH